MYGCLYSHENIPALPNVDESNSDIPFELVILVDILRKPPLQEDTDDGHLGVELSNLTNIFFVEESNKSSVIIMTSHQSGTSEKVISVDDDERA